VEDFDLKIEKLRGSLDGKGGLRGGEKGESFKAERASRGEISLPATGGGKGRRVGR